MGHVLVHGADLAGGRIQRLRISLPNLPGRTIDRETAIAWLKNGHSLIPLVGGTEASALQLVEVGEDAWFIRVDNEKQDSDDVPSLPPA